MSRGPSAHLPRPSVWTLRPACAFLALLIPKFGHVPERYCLAHCCSGHHCWAPSSGLHAMAAPRSLGAAPGAPRLPLSLQGWGPRGASPARMASWPQSHVSISLFWGHFHTEVGCASHRLSKTDAFIFPKPILPPLSSASKSGIAIRPGGPRPSPARGLGLLPSLTCGIPPAPGYSKASPPALVSDALSTPMSPPCWCRLPHLPGCPPQSPR